ncbi:hypothetical protein ED733_008891 [Metarhizium rileyi]|uniref:Uncharacterized protein n=1 Tax=Metarhizium rileyi (strain RCEF 4871) TaxID=1649241 RepID=A0A5C6GQD0_METRR|nr:hypothetical protein ED733_008891 [Metarhizium rileyi]
MLAGNNVRTPDQKRKRDGCSTYAPNGAHQERVVSSTTTTTTGPNVIQGIVHETIQHSTQSKPPHKVTASFNGQPRTNSGCSQFDSLAFDKAIYQQSGAAPPAGVAVAAHMGNKSSSVKYTDYIHANPAIHGMHNRSEAWYEWKTREIQSRGGRKFWFGKTCARIRWLRRLRSKFPSARDVKGDMIPERSVPEPRAYRRPLDFGDVPESELPEEVRQDPEWSRACRWFRQQRNLQDLRLRESKRCEQEANDYYMTISQGGVPDLGSTGGR